MASIGKTFMFIGGLIFIIGLVMQFINIGKLPGDIVIQKGNSTFYFPITTSIIISIVLSLIFFIIGKLR